MHGEPDKMLPDAIRLSKSLSAKCVPEKAAPVTRHVFPIAAGRAPAAKPWGCVSPRTELFESL